MSGLKLGIQSAFIKTTIASVFLLPAFGLAQELIKVSGKITSDQSKPVQNVEVMVRNSKFSTMTNKSGQYELNVPKNATLVIRSKGFEEQEVEVNGKTVINVSLAKYDGNTEKNIDEVVLVGYTTVSKKDVTNSIASVKGDQLADMPVNSAAEAIQGRMAGVQVTFGEGSPGSDPEIKVRGGTSITQDNAPLYIVDGIQMDNALSLISPKEIESIEVLKDASSTSIYGARGANGVVLITTKSGRKNAKTSVNYNGYTGVRTIAKKLDVMSPYDFVQYQYELYNRDGYQDLIDKFVSLYGTYSDIDQYKTIQTRDWQEEVFGKEAFNFTHNLNISGGNTNSAFTLSLNHVEEDGIMINSGYKRNMANFKYDFDISKKLKVGLTARYSQTFINGAGTTTAGSQSTNRLRNVIRYRPFENGVNTGAGSDEFDTDDFAATNLVNPVLLSNNEIKYNNTDNLFLNGIITYNIFKDLTFKSVIGYVQNDQEIQQFSGPKTYLSRINADMSVAQLTNTQTRRITNTNTLAYKKKIGNHKMDFLLGQEIVQTDGDKLDMNIKWLPTSLSAAQAFANIQLAMPPAGMIQDAPATSTIVGRLASFFARANYIYNNKYIATVSVRRDGSNSFGPANRWANFPSASLAWKIGEENFLKDSRMVNDLKLRFGYGQSGNDRIASFLYDTFYTPASTYGYTGGVGVITGSAPGNIMANPNIKWEATVSKNAGLDFTIFNKKVYGAIDAYITDTKDLLLLAKIPQTSGYEYQFQNSGKTQNKGLEFSLGAIIVGNENFTWKTDFNIATNKNTIKSLGSLTQSGTDYYLVPSGWVNNLFDFKVQVNQPVGMFYGYVTEGRYEVSDFDFNAANNTYKLKDGIPTSTSVALGNRAAQPGDLKLRDLNGDGIIDTKDQTDLGNAQPKFYGGFNQTFKYKNFDMSMFFNFSVGNKVYNANKIEFTTKYQYTDQNMLGEMADRWRWFNDDGIKVTDPAALTALNANTSLWTPTGGNYFLHSYAIEDGSFLRLNNVTVGYSLPKDALSMLGITNLRLYATANNVFTITGYSGYDPEVSTRKSTLTPAVDYAAFPRSRFFLTGVDITF